MLELKGKLNLDKIFDSPNIAESMKDEDLKKIAADVCRAYTRDKDSRAKWEKQVRDVIKLATLEHERKDTPFDHASNIKYPLIETAALQFAAHTYPEIVKNGEVVHTNVKGDDPDNSKHEIARVIADHMNYQLLVDNSEFEIQLDKITHTLPLIGVAFMKIYYDPCKYRNVIEAIPYNNVFINADVHSLEDARYVTHKLELHKNVLLERMRSGSYCELDEKILNAPPISQEGSETHVVLEQHRYLDLDKDGYEEPYIVTVFERTQDVLRIVARWDADGIQRNAKNKVKYIKPITYFVDFHCLPNPDGSYYSVGLGQLLYGSNHALNSLINQIADAGTLSNLQTGIVGRGFRIKGGELRMKPGCLMKVDTAITGKLSDEIHMMDYKPPSPVLFQLFDLLLTGAKEMSSMTDVSTGNAQVQNVASSVLANQQSNGMVVYSGIQKRIFRSLKNLFELYYYFNSVFLDPQDQFLMPGRNVPISKNDYRVAGISIKPVADPNVSSDIQRMQIDQQLLQLLEQPAVGQFLNGFGVVQHVVEDMKVRDPNQILKPPDPNAPPPLEVLQAQSEMQQKAADTQLKAHALDLQQQDVMTRAHVAQSEIAKNQAAATLALAQAHYTTKQPKIQEHQQAMDAIMAGHKNEMDLQKEHVKGQYALDKEKAKPQPKSGE